jgi:4-amino-4-deoxy-L-arabinose transferase-like glycosyltransferase
MNTKIHIPFWILTFGLAIFLLAPFYVQDGMFTDGIIYASVSRNLAQGIGDYWQPLFSCSGEKIFYEQPPFALWLQSFFFRFLGNSFFVERIYCAFTYIFACFSLFYFWKTLNPTAVKIAWLPIFFYTITPLVFWSYRHNMLENTMLIFDVWAIIFFFKTAQNSVFLEKRNILYLTLGTFFIFLSVLTKGLVGLFPLAFFGLYFLVYLKKINYLIAEGFSVFLLLASYFVLLFSAFPKSLYFFKQYVDIQLLRSLRGEREAYDSGGKFLLLERLIQELIPMILVAFLLVLINYLIKKKLLLKVTKEIILLVLIGLSASLPMLISPKQHSYYLVPCFVYFALAVAQFTLPFVKDILDRLLEQKNIVYFIKIFSPISIILLIFSVLYTVKNINAYSRNELILRDIHTLEKNIPACTSFGIDADYCSEYFIGAYLQRYGNFDTACDNQQSALFLSRIDKNLEQRGYSRDTILGLKYFILWRKNR